MSVKSTVTLTRQEAEQKFMELYAYRKAGKVRAKAAKLSDRELEDKLERWNDEKHDGEGYENYAISEYKDPHF